MLSYFAYRQTKTKDDDSIFAAGVDDAIKSRKLRSLDRSPPLLFVAKARAIMRFRWALSQQRDVYLP
jgi:hypothetical protein